MSDSQDLTTFHLRQAIGGEPGSLDWIIGRFTPVLLIAAERRLGPHLRRFYDAEDVVNELWVATIPRLSELVPRADRLTPVLLRYLSTSLVSRINNLARRFARDRRQAVDGAAVGVGAERPAEITDAVSRVARGEDHRILREALGELSESDREIIILRGIEQGANQEVARALGVPAGTAAVRFHRALERLRTRLRGTVLDDIDS